MGRITLFVPSLNGGGAERVMVNLARGFTARGHRVDLVLGKAEGPYLADVPSEVDVVNLGVSRTLHSLVPLARYFRRTRPNVVMSTLNHANLVAIWAKMLSRVSFRLIIREANTFAMSDGRTPSPRDVLWLQLLRRSYPLADAVIANSQGTARDLCRFVKLQPSDVEVIYNPVVTPELFERANEPLDHPWFAAGESPVVLGVGRLTEQKDFSTLIHAFAIVRKSRPARLVILGEGEQRPKLERLIRDLGLVGSVDLPGFVDNPYKYMKQSALFVLSSRWEGFGNVLVEAMALGTPIVSTDVHGGPREILQNGRWGKLVPVGDSEALAKSILQELDEGQCNNAHERAMDFSLDVCLEKYEKVLLEKGNSAS